MYTNKVPTTVMFSGTSWSFYECVKWIIDTNPIFNQAGPGIRLSIRLMTALEGKAVGDEFTWRDDDAKELADLVCPKDPRTGLPDLKAKGPAEGFSHEWFQTQLQTKIENGETVVGADGKPILTYVLGADGKPIMTPLKVPGSTWCTYIDVISPPDT